MSNNLFNKVLFFGCTGFIGSRLLSILLNDGVRVHCILHKRRIKGIERLSYSYGDLKSLKWEKIKVSEFDAIFILARAHSAIQR